MQSKINRVCRTYYMDSMFKFDSLRAKLRIAFTLFGRSVDVYCHRHRWIHCCSQTMHVFGPWNNKMIELMMYVHQYKVNQLKPVKINLKSRIFGTHDSQILWFKQSSEYIATKRNETKWNNMERWQRWWQCCWESESLPYIVLHVNHFRISIAYEVTLLIHGIII